MPIGDTFPHTVPAVGAAGTTYAETVNDILDELIDRVSEPIPLSSLDGGTLDLNNAPLLDVQYTQFYPQTEVPAASPLYRTEVYGGELYWIGDSGAVKITEGASLNPASVGGIGGDYAGNLASLDFVDGGNRYDFFDDATTSTWAYARLRGVDIANSATGTFFAQLRYAGTSTLSFSFPISHPSTGRAVVLIDTAGLLSHNDDTNTITENIQLGGSTKIIHGNRTRIQSPVGGYASSGTFVNAVDTTGFGVLHTVAGVTATYSFPLLLEVGWRVKTLVFRLKKAAASSTGIKVNLATTNAAFIAEIGSGTTSSSGLTDITISLGTPETILATEQLFCVWTPSDVQDVLYAVEITYDVVA